MSLATAFTGNGLAGDFEGGGGSGGGGAPGSGGASLVDIFGPFDTIALAAADAGVQMNANTGDVVKIDDGVNPPEYYRLVGDNPATVGDWEVVTLEAELSALDGRVSTLETDIVKGKWSFEASLAAAGTSLDLNRGNSVPTSSAPFKIPAISTMYAVGYGDDTVGGSGQYQIQILVNNAIAFTSVTRTANGGRQTFLETTGVAVNTGDEVRMRINVLSGPPLRNAHAEAFFRGV